MQSISLNPTKASSYAALGYTKHLSNDIDGAIQYYHQALGIKPEDTFSTEMLHRALNESFLQQHFLDEDSDFITKPTTRFQNLTIQNSAKKSSYDSDNMDDDSNFSFDVPMS